VVFEKVSERNVSAIRFKDIFCGFSKTEIVVTMTYINSIQEEKTLP
jgi:hypothetical protein